MKYLSYIGLFIILSMASLQAQQGGGGDRGGFSLSNLMNAKKEIPDSLLLKDSLTRRINAYHLSYRLGEAYEAPMDTNRLNTANSTLMEGRGLAVSYLGNLGSPAQSRIFSERKESRDFIFADAYDYYILTPTNVFFYDTKVPYTHLTYTSMGGGLNKEEQLKGFLTTNFGKKINIGGEADYMYGRGYYNSNGTKLLNYRFFGSYRSDRYELNAHYYSYNFVNNENGGLTEDRYITDYDNLTEGKSNVDSKGFPVRYADTWNRVRGGQFFFTHRYNLGFTKELSNATDSLGNPLEVFIPVSSIIHTFDFNRNSRRFISESDTIDNQYANRYGKMDSIPNDVSSSWNLNNTLALSLREGFQDWAKFGLTAFIALEKRSFSLPNTAHSDSLINNYKEGEFSTYVGGEISKHQGKLLTYDARGELCIVGDDIGEFRLSGNLQTQFPLLGKPATIKANGSIYNVTPAFFQRHNHTRYFWWDNDFGKTRHVYAGGEIGWDQTHTRISAGVENIQNHVYFGQEGIPVQEGDNIQVLTARFKQDFLTRSFGWENEIAYQKSSKESVLPLPQISAYTNIYCTFKMAKVLTIQMGADAHYFTKYEAPYYEPATQQFQLQKDGTKLKIGEYPIINAYVNCHLKQARFFVMGYNLGSLFIDPDYFSLPHYPLNPMVLKLGISVYFNN